MNPKVSPSMKVKVTRMRSREKLRWPQDKREREMLAQPMFDGGQFMDHYDFDWLKQGSPQASVLTPRDPRVVSSVATMLRERSQQMNLMQIVMRSHFTMSWVSQRKADWILWKSLEDSWRWQAPPEETWFCQCREAG